MRRELNRKKFSTFTMRRMLQKNRVLSIICAKINSNKVSHEPEIKNGILNNDHRRFSRKKALLVLAIIAIMIVPFFAFLPRGNQNMPQIVPQDNISPSATPDRTSQVNNQSTRTPNPAGQLSSLILSGISPGLFGLDPQPDPPGTFEAALIMNSTVWQQVAANAWQYFKPGLGVDSSTGLPGSGIDVPFFTDWDLGVYIQAVIDANTTGLIGYDGDWGSSARLEKVVSFWNKKGTE